MSEEEIHDTSRLDAFMAARRRSMLLHASWRPALAGAAGAALIIAAVWVATPKFVVREVVVDHVTPHDVPFDNHVPVEKPFDNYVPHETPFTLPVPTLGPQAEAKPPMGPQAPYAAKTPEEKPFVNRPDYKTAQYHGRIVKSIDGRDLSFADGQNVYPAHWDDVNSKVVEDRDRAYDADQYVGDLGMCTIDTKGFWLCTAFHNGKETPIYHKPYHASAADKPTLDATAMVMVDVTVGNYPVEAMVDTGCSFPMAVPKVYADTLIRVGLATKISSSQVALADGSLLKADVISIKSITVDGRTLHDVEASVSPSDNAPILLGLGALNRLGPYSIEAGKLVFTGEQPA